MVLVIYSTVRASSKRTISRGEHNLENLRESHLTTLSEMEYYLKKDNLVLEPSKKMSEVQCLLKDPENALSLLL